MTSERKGWEWSRSVKSQASEVSPIQYIYNNNKSRFEIFIRITSWWWWGGGGGGGTVYVQYQKEAAKKSPVKYDCVNCSSKEITLKYQYGKCVGWGDLLKRSIGRTSPESAGDVGQRRQSIAQGSTCSNSIPPRQTGNRQSIPQCRLLLHSMSRPVPETRKNGISFVGTISALSRETAGFKQRERGGGGGGGGGERGRERGREKGRGR